MILWEGESEFGGGAIAVIATGLERPSSNVKTGDMVQLWILDQDTNPVDGVSCGSDYVICGDCPLRGGNGCYVNVGQAPLAVWRKYRAGGYPYWTGEDFHKPVRLGAYGDMGAVPSWVVRKILQHCRAGYTGYTHAWRDRPDLRDCCMASVHNRAEYAEARLKGWRTFRTTDDWPTVAQNEIECPSERGITCASCKMCSGMSGRHVRDIWIPAHGSGKGKVVDLI
jgi:hypothetical protein